MSFEVRFDEQKDIVYSARFVASEARPTAPDWSTLATAQSFKDAKILTHLWRGEHIELTAIMLGMAWRLAKGFEVFAIGNYYRDKAARESGLAYELIDWEYDVQLGPDTEMAVEIGFVPGRACVNIQPPPTEWEMAHRNQAGLFHIGTIRQLFELQAGLTADVSSEVSLFCIGAGRKAELLALLRGAHPPELREFLRDRERFVDVGIGNDLGYRSSLIVKAMADLSNEIEAMVGLFNRAIAVYEQESAGHVTLNEALLALQRLSLGQPTGNI